MSGLEASGSGSKNYAVTGKGICIRVLSFDLDDTIWDNKPVLAAAAISQREHLRQNFPNISQKYDDDKLKELWKEVSAQHTDSAHNMTFMRKKMIENMAIACGEENLEEVVSSTFRAFIQTRSDVSKYVFPGVLDTLRRLKARGYVMVSCTNGNADIRSVPELHSIFDHHVSAETVGAAKPHVLPFEKVLELTGASPEEVLHIGDSLTSDVRGANNVGMHAIWVNRNTTDENNEATATIRCVSEIEQVLDHLLN
mmetsp:Transcript_8811/g.11108  ORF Transcript_8811/g.11108 Transcript_8811/m.11108 type:complete len:254 (-) Transcript_8811:1513-2274(-)|eukprot:CAMPEP_0204854368 /NCGR_PEP_ID=MMETSP1347-20130617/15059_1 /ASSEMBLY_ACC=CAM_ASM_000690 /TAXON_ID=215587 /ORGANISM="Aplanochytrium stocchinoi, Strain GSBS06" /LENGTH=253 /DNA_ID=CAMNT_0051999897 /DNA_START=105 /DNA_END=866 /DNA_ORIENTATION=+